MEIYTIDIEEQLKVLRECSKTVENIDQELVDFSSKMTEAIQGVGIGLAAPQVGRNERFFVCHIGEEPLVFINPEITATSEAMSPYEEGCLSIPGVYYEVLRPSEIEIQAWSLKGRPFKMELGGLLATCFQHELDHLNGVLFIDRLSEGRREKALKEYDKRIRGKK